MTGARLTQTRPATISLNLLLVCCRFFIPTQNRRVLVCHWCGSRDRRLARSTWTSKGSFPPLTPHLPYPAVSARLSASFCSASYSVTSHSGLSGEWLDGGAHTGMQYCGAVVSLIGSAVAYLNKHGPPFDNVQATMARDAQCIRAQLDRSPICL